MGASGIRSALLTLDGFSELSVRKPRTYGTGFLPRLDFSAEQDPSHYFLCRKDISNLSTDRRTHL